MTSELNNASRLVADRDQLSVFVSLLAAQVRDEPNTLENTTLDSYLDALAAWIADCDGYFAGRGEQVPDSPTWSLLAEMLAAATVYE